MHLQHVTIPDKVLPRTVILQRYDSNKLETHGFIIAISRTNLQLKGVQMLSVIKSSLKRPVYEMPDFIVSALQEHHLYEAYRSRPPYQQNDYIGWITRAKREVTKQRRLDQMLSELSGGELYMNMKYTPKHRKD
jgi:hypothetical protein